MSTEQTAAPERARFTVAEAIEWAKSDPATWAKITEGKRKRPRLSARQKASIGRTLKGGRS